MVSDEHRSSRSDFGDNTGGFYLYGKGHEELILRPKEAYDGAIPSGNSLMAYNLVCLSLLTDEERYKTEAERQLDFLSKNASQYPTNHVFEGAIGVYQAADKGNNRS